MTVENTVDNPFFARLWTAMSAREPEVLTRLRRENVADPDDVVRQLYSRLRPAGELRYLEHVASPGARGGLQRAADATIWPRLLGNCHTHRDTERSIRAAGFEIPTERHEWTMPKWVPLPVSEFALGRAVKPRS